MTHPFTPSRRSLLGLIASAPAIVAAAPATTLACETSDWRTKPLDQWTRDDFVAEAEFQVAAADARNSAAPHNRTHRIVRDWWARERAALVAGRAA